MEIHEGCYGGRYGKDGMDAVDTLYANTRNNPIEDVESHFPLRVHRYELREDSCPAGRWRGGIGPIRDRLARGHPVAGIVGEEIEPFLQAKLAQQANLAVEELLNAVL
jgi:N-methylhydantoinase B/oxoprolinase/acetone carboxylase alpha subunit